MPQRKASSRKAHADRKKPGRAPSGERAVPVELPAGQPKLTRLLGIETSCDETAAAVVEDGRHIASSVVASQVGVHAKYGGVFPEVASRMHIEAILPVVQEALSQAHIGLEGIDAVAVTRGPGLAGSLVVGLNFAKGLALSRGLPLLGINHLEAHLYSIWLVEDEPEPSFPLLALIVSGGHTELVLMRDHLQYQRLGGTLDDAAGEAFDKVARLLGLGYPGGPAIQQEARSGNPKAYRFPRAWLEGTWDFSFSGLKTAVLREVRALQPKVQAGIEPPAPGLPLADLAASFQAAVVEVLVEKTVTAAEAFKAQTILVAGGVSANQALRQALAARTTLPARVPPLSLCTDNAAMIAAAGHRRLAAGQRDALDIDVLPGWSLGV